MASRQDTNFDFDSLPDRSGTGALKWERYSGRSVLPMWVADMDFVSPPAVIDAIHTRVDHGVFGYTDPYPAVQDAVIEYMQGEHGLAIEREWLLWLPGLVPALNTAARAHCAPNEAVLTNTPVYPPFLSAPLYQGRVLQAVPLVTVDDQYTFDFEAMQLAVDDRSRVFFLCNPHNPVGRAWRQEELTDVIEFCRRNSLVLISDEIHCDLILDPDIEHHTCLSLDNWTYEHSITLMSPSKTYNLCGLACSFVIIPNSQLRRCFHRATRGLFNELNCLGYAACEAAYRYSGSWRDELRDVLRDNYALLRNSITTQMPRITMLPIEATYLAWLDVRNLQLPNARQYFEEAGVGLSDGAEFGWPGYLRLNFGCPKSMLSEALARMEQAYRAIPAKGDQHHA